MDRTIPHVNRKQVDASHWALWEKPQEVNELISTWLKDEVFSKKGGSTSKL